MATIVPLPPRRKPAAKRRRPAAPPGALPRLAKPSNDNRPPPREILLRALFWLAVGLLAATWWLGG